jgi:hypothetical protein
MMPNHNTGLFNDRSIKLAYFTSYVIELEKSRTVAGVSSTVE